MRRKPAIILLYCLFLLSIGGAMLHHHFRKHFEPSFTEVDSFLRHSVVSGDWRFESHDAMPQAWETIKGAFGIRRKVHKQMDIYRFTDASNSRLVVSVLRNDGEIRELYFQNKDRSNREAFKGIVFGKFPELGRYNRTGPPWKNPSH